MRFVFCDLFTLLIYGPHSVETYALTPFTFLRRLPTKTQGFESSKKNSLFHEVNSATRTKLYGIYSVYSCKAKSYAIYQRCAPSESNKITGMSELK